MRSRRLPALVLAVALTAAAAPAAEAGPKTYVALGDSFAAGPAIPAYAKPWGCLKSTNNYPNLVAQTLGASLKDATCSGASTPHMTREHGVFPDGPNPPQLDFLDAGTDVVTLQIGGNDIGFGGIAEDCTRAAFEQVSCRSKLGGKDEEIAETAPKIAAVIQGIRARAPGADIYLLGYPGIFRHEADGAASCPAMGVGEDDAVFLRDLQKSLNQMIADTAVANGAGYVDVYGPSRGRTACDLPAVRWVEPIAPTHAAAPIHPNLNGMLGMRDEVVKAIKRKLAGNTDVELPVPLPVATPSNPY